MEGDDLIARLRSREGRPGPAGSVVLRERLPGDARVIVFPGVVAVEGRLGAIETGDEDDHSLWDPAALGHAAASMADAIAPLVEKSPGLCPVGPAEVRRLDLAGELRFSDGRDGLAFLDALAGLSAPRRKVVCWRKAGTAQTVYWVTESGRVCHRAYDKGVESGTAAAGERIRIELQHRPPKGRRMRPHDLATSDLSALYIGALGGWTTSRPIVRGEAEAVMAALLDRVERGEMTRRKAESLVGQLVGLRVDGGDALEAAPHAYRLRELRRAGIVLDRPVVEREIPVQRHLAELRSRFAA